MGSVKNDGSFAITGWPALAWSGRRQYGNELLDCHVWTIQLNALYSKPHRAWVVKGELAR